MASARGDNPEGRSILRNAYFSWYFEKKIAEIEGIGIARDLAGLPRAPLVGHGPRRPAARRLLQHGAL